MPAPRNVQGAASLAQSLPCFTLTSKSAGAHAWPSTTRSNTTTARGCRSIRQIFAHWARDGAAYRDEAGERRPRRDRPEVWAIAAADHRPVQAARRRRRPLALFIHGGYWRSLEPSSFSQMARGMNAHGVTVAVSGYDLAPQVSIGQIIEQTQAACLYLWKQIQKAHHGERSLGRRASRRLHGCDRLEGARPGRSRRSRAGRLCDFRAVRSCTAAASRHQRRLQARRSRGAADFAAVLAGGEGPRARRRGRRRRVCRSSCGRARSSPMAGRRRASQRATRRCRA